MQNNVESLEFVVWGSILINFTGSTHQPPNELGNEILKKLCTGTIKSVKEHHLWKIDNPQ